MIAVISALADSPLVWFFLLVGAISLIGLLLLVVIHGGSRKPTPATPPTPDFDSPAARRYHGDNGVGR